MYSYLDWNCVPLCLATCVVFLAAVSSNLQHADLNSLNYAYANEKVCLGTKNELHAPSDSLKNHHLSLQRRYTNCTFVQGNLELTWLQDQDLGLEFLQHIREVTGYVLIAHVDVNKIALPRLRIIRGQNLVNLRTLRGEFALLITQSKMNSLELPLLRDILLGNFAVSNNSNLCHINTINWDEILSTGYVIKTPDDLALPNSKCPPCHKTCSKGCWSEGADFCQKFSKLFCSRLTYCNPDRCAEHNSNECCHPSCVGGCTGPEPTDCLACRYLYDNGRCTENEECLSIQQDHETSNLKKTNLSKYIYGATCVHDCPHIVLKEEGTCLRSCPPHKRAENGDCLDCVGDELCPKICKGDVRVDDANINRFVNCTEIEGWIDLHISDSSFESWDTETPGIMREKLDVFSTLKHITGRLSITGSGNYKDLNCFRNLEIIGGDEHYGPSLEIQGTPIKYLGFKSLKEVLGGVSIEGNNRLCYTQSLDWKRIIATGPIKILNNKNETDCEQDNEVCDSECSQEGCWGPGNHLCVSCEHLQYNGICLSNCNESQPASYQEDDRHCSPCHEECVSCFGPSSSECEQCQHVQEGQWCVQTCSYSMYNNSGKCASCHAGCSGGCEGPEDSVGPNGCKKCRRAVYNGDSVERCLQYGVDCPNGYYMAGSHSSDCRQCPPLCKSCTWQGGDEPKVKCVECEYYQRHNTCVEECLSDEYADNITHQCLPCSLACDSCYSEDSMDCYSCPTTSNSSLIALAVLGLNSTLTDSDCKAGCSLEFPFKNYNDDGEPFCSKGRPKLEPTLPTSTLPTSTYFTYEYITYIV